MRDQWGTAGSCLTPPLPSAHALDRGRSHPLPQRPPARPGPGPRRLARATRRHARAGLPDPRVPRVWRDHAVGADLQLEVTCAA